MSARPTRGMVLAAGLGTRMRAVSETIPKPLVPVAGKPLIAHALDGLERSSVAEIVVNTHHLAAEIETFLADHMGRPSAPRIHISREEERLETGGGVRQALHWLDDEAFYVVNSDVVLVEQGAPALARLAEVWDGEAMDALLLLCPLARALGYEGAGDFFRHDDGRLSRRGTAAAAPFVFTGTQILHPRLFVGAAGRRLLAQPPLRRGHPRGTAVRAGASRPHAPCRLADRTRGRRALFRRRPGRRGRMSARAPTLYTVPPHEPFVDTLAEGLLAGRVMALDTDDPLALSRLTILLPTRRACRALGLAFLRAAPGQALLLPRIRPLGDIDEDEPSLGDEEDETLPDAVSPLERRLLLARLVLKLGETAGGAALTGAGAVDQAARLARALAGLLDEIQIARLDPQGLADLAPEEYAAHWQQVLRFLSLITDSWPAILAEKGLMDPAARRNALLEALAERWAATPPAHPVIAAGSTGSVPATRDLLAVIARLPQGAVVLPGLDTQADDETWEAIGPTHPQYALKGLLAHIGVERGSVEPWPTDDGDDGDDGGAADRARSRLMADAMRPAETITAWRALPAPEPAALRDLHRIDCASPQEEAGVIAIVMRRALETPGRTAALVTADRALARRVAAELRRWRIEVDDSAGEPLGETAPGALLRLTARMIAERAAPVPCSPRSSIRSRPAARHPQRGGAPYGPWKGRSCAAPGRRRASAACGQH